MIIFLMYSGVHLHRKSLAMLPLLRNNNTVATFWLRHCKKKIEWLKIQKNTSMYAALQTKSPESEAKKISLPMFLTS